METKPMRPAIPAREFDKEYNTQWRKEMEFLRDKGIEYTFAKRIGDYKIPTYKYKKTPRLFLALAEFYNQQQFQRNLDAIDKLTADIEKEMPIEKGYIEIQPDKAEEQLLSNMSNENILDQPNVIEKMCADLEKDDTE